MRIYDRFEKVNGKALLAVAEEALSIKDRDGLWAAMEDMGVSDNHGFLFRDRSPDEVRELLLIGLGLGTCDQQEGKTWSDAWLSQYFSVEACDEQEFYGGRYRTLMIQVTGRSVPGREGLNQEQDFLATWKDRLELLCKVIRLAEGKGWALFTLLNSGSGDPSPDPDPVQVAGGENEG